MTGISKKIALLTTILVVILYFFNKADERCLSATKSTGKKSATAVTAKDLSTCSIKSSRQRITTWKRDKLNKISEVEYLVDGKFRSLKQFLGISIKPLALVNAGKLCVINRDGDIIRSEPLLSDYDLPVLTGQQFVVDDKKGKIVGGNVSQCLYFLTTVCDFNFPLYNQISEVKMDDKLGMIAYLKKSCLPVIIGNEYMNRKVAYLSAVLPELESKNLLDLALYLDIRLNGQVILKKRG